MKTFKKYIFEMTELPEPGVIPIPNGHIRLYHYTNPRKSGISPEKIAEVLRKEGINIRHAKGSSYGEPNVVWASAAKPNHNHIFAEFSVSWNDPRFIIGRPQSFEDAKHLEASGGNVAFNDSIKPDEIIAVHEPWHQTYHYLLTNKMIPEILAGDYDYLLDGKHPKEATAIQYIKKHNPLTSL